MSKLTQALKVCKSTFVKYAGADGDEGILNKRELSALLTKEFALDRGTRYAATEYFLSQVDEDADGVVNFLEFLGSSASLCSEIECFTSGDEPVSEFRKEMENFKEIYNSNAVTRDDKLILTKVELVGLLKKEFPEMETISNEEAHKLLSDMDNDKDGVVDFKEFVCFAARISTDLHLI